MRRLVLALVVACSKEPAPSPAPAPSPPPLPPPVTSAPADTSRGMRLAHGPMSVHGGDLPAEVVKRIVGQNFGRFRLCYIDGLAKDPQLVGRIIARFDIDRTGSVVNASDSDSDVPDQDVRACIMRAFGNITFPQPSAVVKVMYTVILLPPEP